MNIIAEKILPQLEGIKKTGEGKWMARCPVHNDSHPSMLINDAVSKNGEPTITMHCFACQASIDEICSALGLTIGDLYPDKTKQSYKSSQRKHFPAKDVLCSIANDALFVELCARDLENQIPISKDDLERLTAARMRIENALEYIKH